MKKLLLLFIVIICMHMCIRAQELKPRKITLHSISSIGLLNGSSGAGYSVQSILGASLHRSFAGIGIGIDQYHLRSVPLFIDLRQELGGALRNVFLYGDGGYNFGWITDNQKSQLLLYNPQKFRGGLYYDIGLGYTVKFSSGDALLFTAGYTFKQLNDKVSSIFCSQASCSTNYDTYRYHLQRIILKAGLRF
jgi:hypothetical protein